MSTLVVSDLHLGSGRDVLRFDGPREDLCAAIAQHDRLVLLGDVVELRHGPVRDAFARAEPILRALGEAAQGKPVTFVAGNHDRALLDPWFDARTRDGEPPPLAVDERVDPDLGPWLARLVELLGGDVEVRYPGVWLRDDVYAHHGHLLDRFITVPTFERLLAGAMERVVGPMPERDATPDDLEAALAPIYAWMHAVAQGPGARWAAKGAGQSAKTWETLTGAGPRPLRARAMAALFPLAVRGLNKAGVGPVRPQLSGDELRRAGLAAMGEVVTRLGVDARHVVFGHTHRAGPLPRDAASEWRTAAGTTLHNSGSWIAEDVFLKGEPDDSPYAAGRGVRVPAAGPPEPLRVSSRPR